jgi:hypothetical protein
MGLYLLERICVGNSGLVSAALCLCLQQAVRGGVVCA